MLKSFIRREEKERSELNSERPEKTRTQNARHDVVVGIYFAIG